MLRVSAAVHAADAADEPVGPVGPLFVGIVVVVVHVVDAAVSPHVAAAVAVDQGAQGPVEALGQEAALGVEYAARS